MKKQKSYILAAALLASVTVASGAPMRSPSIDNLRLTGFMKADNDRSVENTGIYSYNATAPVVRKLITPIKRAYVNADAVIMDGKIHSYTLTIDYGYINSAKYYTYDIVTGEQLSAVNITYSDLDLAYSNYATASAVRPSDGTVFSSGVKYDSTDNTLSPELKTWDIAGNTKSAVGPMQAQLCLMAFGDDGTLYGITASSSRGSADGGRLVTVDTATGNLTIIGDTGLRPWYDQGGTISPYDGKLYWFCCQPGDADDINSVDAALYTVDLSTGSASKIGDLPNGEEVVAVSIPQQTISDDAPSAVGNLSVHFTAPSLAGTVNFTLPTKNYSGNPLAGQLTWTVVEGETTLASGNGEAGAEVSAPVEVKGSGTHTINVYVSNGAGTSLEQTVTQYIGYDVPVAIKSVTLSIADGTNTLSWDCPDASVNGGYMRPDDLRYRIVRQPANVEVASAWEGTVFTEAALDGELQSIFYEVTPVNGDAVGATTKSNSCVSGSSIALPWSEDFTEANSLDLFTIIDANNDGNKWYYSVKAVKYRQSTTSAADDWLMLPPAKLEEGKSYEFTFDGYNTSATNQNILDVAMGTSASPDAMTDVLKSDISYEGSTSRAPITTTVVIKPSATAVYYIGMHLKSPSRQNTFTLDNFALSAGKSTAIPAAPAFTATAGEKGELSARLDFTKPELTAGGKPLANAVTSFVVGRDGAVIATIPATSETSYSFTDSSIDKSGKYVYTVTAINADGNGEQASAELFVGRDEPLAPASALLTDNFDGTAAVTWEMPAPTGVNGGYVDTDKLVFSVSDASGNILVADVKGTATVVPLDNTGEQKKASVKVAAGYAGEAASSKAVVASNEIISGKPYALPYAESFADAKTGTSLWVKETVAGKSYDTSWDARGDADQDGNGGGADMTGYAPGAASRWCSPKIDISGSKNPVVSLYVKIPTGNMSFELQAQKEFGEWETIAVVADAPDWTEVKAELKKFESPCVRIGLLGSCIRDINYVYADNLKVEDKRGSGAALTEADGNLSVISGVGTLTVSTVTPSIVAIYSLTGVLLHSAEVESVATFTLPAGIYIVASANSATKAVVR